MHLKGDLYICLSWVTMAASPHEKTWHPFPLVTTLNLCIRSSTLCMFLTLLLIHNIEKLISFLFLITPAVVESFTKFRVICLFCQSWTAPVLLYFSWLSLILSYVTKGNETVLSILVPNLVSVFSLHYFFYGRQCRSAGPSVTTKTFPSALAVLFVLI